MIHAAQPIPHTYVWCVHAFFFSSAISPAHFLMITVIPEFLHYKMKNTPLHTLTRVSLSRSFFKFVYMWVLICFNKPKLNLNRENASVKSLHCYTMFNIKWNIFNYISINLIPFSQNEAASAQFNTYINYHNTIANEVNMIW